jgi:hypothetical protein
MSPLSYNISPLTECAVSAARIYKHATPGGVGDPMHPVSVGQRASNWLNNVPLITPGSRCPRFAESKVFALSRC